MSRCITLRYPDVDYLFIEIGYIVAVISKSSRGEEVHIAKTSKKTFSTLDNKLNITITVPHSMQKGTNSCKVIFTECT